MYFSIYFVLTLSWLFSSPVESARVHWSPTGLCGGEIRTRFLCLCFSLHWVYWSKHDMASSPLQPGHQKCGQFGCVFGVCVLHYSFWALKMLPKWLCLSSFVILSSFPPIWTWKLRLNWLWFLCLGFSILIPSCFLVTRLSSSCTTYLMHYLVKYDLKHLKWLKITEIVLIALDSVLE